MFAYLRITRTVGSAALRYWRRTWICCCTTVTSWGREAISPIVYGHSTIQHALDFATGGARRVVLRCATGRTDDELDARRRRWPGNARPVELARRAPC